MDTHSDFVKIHLNRQMFFKGDNLHFFWGGGHQTNKHNFYFSTLVSSVRTNWPLIYLCRPHHTTLARILDFWVLSMLARHNVSFAMMIRKNKWINKVISYCKVFSFGESCKNFFFFCECSFELLVSSCLGTCEFQGLVIRLPKQGWTSARNQIFRSPNDLWVTYSQ